MRASSVPRRKEGSHGCQVSKRRVVGKAEFAKGCEAIGYEGPLGEGGFWGYMYGLVFKGLGDFRVSAILGKSCCMVWCGLRGVEVSSLRA